MAVNRRYTHRPFGEEVRAIGGAYYLEKELRLDHRGCEVLVVVGTGVIDSSCCGTGGCRYAFVPGFLRGWHDQTGEDDLPASTVEPIRDKADRSEIEKKVREREIVQSIEFW
jgi:hypothetical protein